MNNGVFIRADGDEVIGLGHLVRCYALAEMLKSHFNVSFYCKHIPDILQDEIVEAGFYVYRINQESEFLQVLSGNEIVVVDHYQLDSVYQQQITKKGCVLVSIDDLHNKLFYSDLIVNHAPAAEANDYDAQCYTRFALGLEYALLRPAFLQQAKQERKIDALETVLLCFGGADVKNLTLQALRVLTAERRLKNIVVITGAAYRHSKTLEYLLLNDARIVLYRNITSNEMLTLMSGADLAIVPSSGILLEALVAGNIIISGMYVDNQKFLFEQYKQKNAFISAEDFSEENIRKAVDKAFLQVGQHREKMIDGRSGERLLKLFRQLQLEQSIKLRDAVQADEIITYKWASDPAVRAYSFNKSEIKFDDHVKWFSKRITSNNCYYFIAENGQEPVGSIRFDIDGESAVISYLADPKYHGKGLGAMLLAKGLKALVAKKTADVTTVTGLVISENIASVKAFEKLNFEKIIEGTSLKFTKKL